ncbi:glycoside hydrolase family 2 protein [Whalleya microplaca]|nr:glycoside hydrolase family 2 protein [Whalleya microplaca]
MASLSMSPRCIACGVYQLIYLGLLLINLRPTEAVAIRDSWASTTPSGREVIKLDTDWRFWRSEAKPDNLVYDQILDGSSGINRDVLKPWILPSGNRFINDPAKHHQRPAGNPGGNLTFVQKRFDDSDWEAIKLPHDWAIKGPFYTGAEPPVDGGMGRLPIQGVGWYRRKLSLAPEDTGKSIYLDIDGAMSYAVVWLNENLVGGWPYGYNSFRLDLTPYITPGDDNQLAVRIENPTNSSRWYPGGGLYRNVWLSKVDTTHVAQSGTFITSREVSAESATLDLTIQVENVAAISRQVEVSTEVHEIDSGQTGRKVAEFSRDHIIIAAGQMQSVNGSTTVENPRLWEPLSAKQPHMYVAITYLFADGEIIDTYETSFGIRSVTFNSNQGLLINGERVRIQGVNQHHDLGALGAAFNVRAAERQLETLRDLGCNAIRMSHNPPAPELLDMTDRMGFLVVDEIFDSWEISKTDLDFHLIFPGWHEPDLRAFMRRDRNHPSIIAWSFGNEVGEQHTNETGAAVAHMLHQIVREEDPTRPSMASMNYAKPNMSFPQELDVLSLNYQGEGIRDTPAYSNLAGIRTEPLYAAFHEAFPEKLILSSETASTLSSRGTYVFPVTNDTSAPVNDTSGGNPELLQVSAYELYTAGFGSSPDKVFAAQDKHPFVAGEFVWTGWDYLGEPTPYYTARSSYSGIIDLAGFKKDRFWLYQSRWRPDLQTAHILPHWTWPDRVGQLTPVHVFSAGEEAELFLNGQSQGRQRKEDYTYRFRWDNITYQPGELHVVTYKDGQEWATETVRTAGAATGLRLTADREVIKSDGDDLSFITVEVVNSRGDVVPRADNAITFSLSGAGEIVATDNGDPADMTAFPSKERKAFSGLALVIVRAKAGVSGLITVTATGENLSGTEVTITAS